MSRSYDQAMTQYAEELAELAQHWHDWQPQAACRTVSPAVFFPSHRDEEDAVIIEHCVQCPVRVDCLEYALAFRQTEGIWGALSPANRRTVLTKHLRPELPQYTWLAHPETRRRILNAFLESQDRRRLRAAKARARTSASGAVVDDAPSPTHTTNAATSAA